MNSITRHLTPKTIYAQMKMERQKHKGVFLLMEGATDFRRFEKFIDRSVVSIVVCAGKDNVLGSLDISQEMGFEDCLGFVDLDFDGIDDCAVANDDVVQSDNHDFDMDICRTQVVDRYFCETAIEDRLNSEGGREGLIGSLLDALRPLSALRYANIKKNLRYKLSDVNLYKFFDGYTIDIELMIEEISTGRFGSEDRKAEIRAYIENYKAAGFDPWHFTNGHDLIAAIGISLQNRIGERLIPQCKKTEVERHLRLAFDHADFYASGVAGKIEAWQARQGLTLLRKVA